MHQIRFRLGLPVEGKGIKDGEVEGGGEEERGVLDLPLKYMVTLILTHQKLA